MRLLILTQKVDRNDPVLGFFHRWIEEFAKNFDKLIVICLEEGEYNLPENVEVLSLGKERGISKAGYVIRFYRYIWNERKNYDAVFVHMNQEYVLLGWKLWFLLGKKVYLWRNHAKGSILTMLAVLFSSKVFYTSPSSYTARYRKSVQMPVGIDTDFFKPDYAIQRIPNSILFLGRIAPVKRVMEFIEWIKNENFIQATIAGSALPQDKAYENNVRQKASDLGLSDKIRFVGAVTQDQAKKLYLSNETYVNMTSAGSYDKTIFEAAACEMRILVENADLKILEKMTGRELRDYVVRNHSLAMLIEKLEDSFIRA